jgi:MoaA/NifB/PqqE/SkfB family radical SAM enzyme
MRIASMQFPLFVKWYITQRCNLRCTHCYLTDYTKSPDLEDVLPIIDFLGEKKVVSIVLIGGEPLARRDLVEIVARITSRNIQTKIATNATLIDLAIAKALVNAGARKYQVSLEGATARGNDAIRGAGTFEAAVEGTHALVAAGADVRIAFTLTGDNYAELETMFELASRLRVHGIKLNAFVPMGTGVLMSRKHFLSPSACREIADSIIRHSSRFPDLRVEAGAFVRKIPMPNKLTPPDSTFGCGAGTTSMIINSDLTISACDMLVEEDRTSTALGAPQEIETLWQHDPLFRRWRGHPDGHRTPTIKSFEGVHQHGCHVAFNAYRSNIFNG